MIPNGGDNGQKIRTAAIKVLRRRNTADRLQGTDVVSLPGQNIGGA